MTDECGRFCVYIPRFDIDWIIRWRRLRICLPVIFERPRLLDVLDDLIAELPEPIRPPRPLPDPVPFLLAEGGALARRLEGVAPAPVVDRLLVEAHTAELGGDIGRRQASLERPAFKDGLPPPLPQALCNEIERGDDKAVAARVGIDRKLAARLQPERFIGPFRRCFDVFVPEWHLFSDVPDITFRVTQDIDGDGDEETIYSEGFFDVRWNAGPIGDVTLEASPSALAGVTCDAPPVACEDEPAILFAGLMPLVNPPAPANPYHDNAAGYASRPNRPHASGLIAPAASDFPLGLATAPYAGTVQLYGCNELDAAVYYRLIFSHNGGPPTPFTGLTWPIHRLVGGNLQTQWPVADAAGWYPVVPAAEGWFPQNLLLNWPTGGYGNGLYEIRLELGNAGKAVIATSEPVRLRIDNAAPSGTFTQLRWGTAPSSLGPPVSLICPVVHRPTVSGVGMDLFFQVSYQAAANHLRSVRLTGGGCGGGSPILDSSPPTAQHWHMSALDNAFSHSALFRLPGTSPQGAYSFHLHVTSRAFNPAGGDGGLAADWNYNPVERHIWRSLPVAVVNI